MLGLLLPLRTPSADAAFQLLTLVGGPIVSAVLAITLTAFLVARGERGGWFVLVLFLAGIALEIVLKQFVFQPGPPSELTRDSALLPTFRDLSRYTYPGGHVMRLTFLSTVIGARYVRLRWPLASLTAVVGFGRIYLAAGWTADIVGGVIIGLALATLADLAAERARDRLRASDLTLATP